MDLLADVAAVVQVPRVDPADSFVLHAPLEALARTSLLPRVAPEARRAAEQRLRDVAATFTAFGDVVAPPAPIPADRSPAELAAMLAGAIASGDLDTTDAAAAALAARTDAAALRALLAHDVVPRLAAAGHAPIFLQLLAAVRGADAPPVRAMLRPLVRELARASTWHLDWWVGGGVGERPADDGDALAHALAAVPYLGVPGSDFIFPLMDQAQRSGTAQRTITGVLPEDPSATARVVARIAIRSMLQEPTDYAPYGWTHCLTMPQAVMALADVCPEPVAAAVAATHVVGFRIAFAPDPLDLGWTPARVGGDPVVALEGRPDDAAATVWHLPAEARPAMWRELATRASIHHDAHLVKYVDACLRVAAADPEFEHAALAAAAKLVAWWHDHDGGTGETTTYARS